MKVNFFIITLVFGLMFLATLGFAEENTCDVQVGILNQDPYPAVPGEKLEVVFTISNIDSTDCGEVEFQILEEFPFTLAKNSKANYLIQSGTFTKDYNTQKTIPVDFIVSEDAIDGNNPLEVRYKSSKAFGGYLSEKFDIDVEDVRSDFEVFVSDYNYATKDITFEVLNVGKPDVEAVTVEVEKQDGVKIYGTDKENIGDLSSNEDTSAEFKMDVSGDSIDLVITYSDSIQVRREVRKSVPFDSSLFEDTKKTNDTNYSYWIIALAIVLVIIYLFFRRRKKKK